LTDLGRYAGAEPVHVRLDESVGVEGVLLDDVAQVRHGRVPRLVGARQDRLEEREAEVLDEAVPKVEGAVISPGAPAGPPLRR
jgi:hypothetical protein